MNPWTPLPQDAELERADELLGQADALLRRHRGGEPAPAAAPAPAPAAAADEDLPILTDVVDEADLRALKLPPPAGPTPAASANAAAVPALQPAPQAAPAVPPATPDAAADAADTQLRSVRAALADELVALDTEITRQVEAWLEAELPRIVARELDQLTERLRAEALARLRATLLPALSERIASRIDKLVD